MARTNKYKDDQLVKIPDDLLDLVENIRDEYEREDRFDRDQKVALWSKLENYFNGLQRIYWNAVAKDWRSVDDTDVAETNRHYDKVINTYRAHAESIVAALSTKIPSAFFYPYDADVEEDVSTARACTKIKSKIEKQNNAQLLLIKALMILFNQGTVCAYVFNKKDSKYGTFAVPVYAKEDAIQYTTLLNCKECENNISSAVFQKEKGKVPDEPLECPICGYIGIPTQEEYEEAYPEIVGASIEAKAMTTIEIFSPLFVHLPIYARNQDTVPYLCLKFEQHYAAIKEMYPKLAKKGINKRVDWDSDERGIGVDITNKNLVTVECWWFRPWAYNIIDNKEDEIKKLKKAYPDGIYAVFIDEQLVEINNENLDAHWEISKNPLSTYIHGDPLGKPLAPIQDLSNEVVDLQIETFEHAIPETFVDGTVLDFKKYGESRAKPGMLYPATKPIDGQGLGSAFHSIKTATMSEESDLFLRRLDEKGQFVSASFPSIYGGPATSGSKTAREYSESRAMALQRLGLTWNIEKYFWAGVMSKAVPLGINAMKASMMDENVVEKTSTGFINNWIRQEDLNGRIGVIEADADEELPQTPAQLKDVIIQLLTLKDDVLTEAMYHPNNIPLITKALGAPEFFVPNSDDRNKQYAEFADLLAGIEVEVNPAIDDNVIEAEVCRTFLVSATGMMIKKSNPAGYEAIEVHMKQHMAANSDKGKSIKPEEQPIVPRSPKEPAPGAENPEGDSNVAQFPDVKFKFYHPENAGGILSDDPVVDLEEDDEADNEEETSEDEEESEEQDEDQEVDKEGTKKGTKEEEDPVLTRVEFKDIKAKFPTFFKDFPDLKHAFFREQQFSEIFPTVEDARKAAEIETAYADITAAVVSGDAGKFLSELSTEGADSVKAFSQNFLPAVKEINKDLYFDIIAPQVQQFVKNVYSHGDKSKDDNIKNAAKIVHKILFGGAYEDIEGDAALINDGRTKSDPAVERDKQNYFAGKYRALNGEVTKTCYDALEAEITKGLEDLNKQPGLKKIIAKEVRSKILEEMDKDALYIGRMNANWKKEERNGFSGTHKSAFLNLFLAKARTLVPKVRGEVRRETLGKNDNKEDRDKREPSRISGGGEHKGGSKGGKMNIDRVKKENLTTRQVFDD